MSKIFEFAYDIKHLNYLKYLDLLFLNEKMVSLVNQLAL